MLEKIRVNYILYNVECENREGEGEKKKGGREKKRCFLLRHKKQSLSKKRFYMSKHNTNRLHAAMTIINHSPLSNTHTHTHTTKVDHGPLYIYTHTHTY